MKILKIDHLGIAVNSIDEGKKFWADILGLKFEGSETVTEQKVTTAFFPVSESEVELLESTAPDGPVAKYIEKKGKKRGRKEKAIEIASNLLGTGALDAKSIADMTGLTAEEIEVLK